MQPLPIDPLLPDIVAAVRRHGALVLEAPPGAGKTTRVPSALLEGGGSGEVVVLEPRRLAARMAARRVAEERGERVGDAVGYQVRFEDVSSARTRIRFVTEGVLTRKIVSDPTLRDVGVVVLDEFHERHLHGDVALALLRRLRRTVRPDLRVVVMSATLGAAPVAAYLEAPTLRSEGRLHAVTVEYADARDDRPLPLRVASAVRGALAGSAEGHVLVFLPGASEIRKARDACAKIADEHGARLLALHGDLSPAEQDRAVAPSRERKVILATNVAESSVTIDGVVVVVDSGLARVAEHAPWSGLPTRRTAKISRASAVQRAGRAGRTRPGRCVRLYDAADFAARPEYDTPEILRADYAETYLELATMGALDVDWLDAPSDSATSAAKTLLARLGAVDTLGDATPLGKQLAKLPLHPRLGRVLLEARRSGVESDGAVVASLLGERDLRLEQRAAFGETRGRDAATEPSDVLALLDLFREAEARGFSESAMRSLGLDGGKTRAVAQAAQRLAPRRPSALSPAESDVALRRALLAGYPDRVARRGETTGRARSRSLALAFGGSAELSEASVVRDAPWVVAVDAELERGRVVVRLASAIEPEWLIDLAPELIVEDDAATWNATAERVDVTSRMTWGGLVLSESEGSSGGAEASRVLAKAAVAAGWRSFDPSGSVARWLERVRFVAHHDAHVPAPTDADVVEALVRLCEGRRSFAELRAAGLAREVAEAGTPGVAGRLDGLAPERVRLGGGRSVDVHYEPGKPPWIESRLQDFFGTADGPRLLGGKVPLVLHLLAPNGRAVQVTTDLAGFWARHYPALRKELARKYPRHAWPDDPRHAAPPAPRPPRR